MKSGKLLGIVAVTLAAWLSYCQISAMATHPLHVRLAEIMDERKLLWTMPQNEGGTREPDVSAIVCPIVTEAELNELIGHPKVEYRFFEESQISPPNSKRWTITGDRVDLLGVAQLIIVLAPDGYCEARYQHIK